MSLETETTRGGGAAAEEAAEEAAAAAAQAAAAETALQTLRYELKLAHEATTRAVEEHWRPEEYVRLRRSGDNHDRLAAYCEQLATALADVFMNVELRTAAEQCAHALDMAQPAAEDEPSCCEELVAYMGAACAAVKELAQSAQSCGLQLDTSVVSLQQEMLEALSDEGGSASAPLRWRELQEALKVLWHALREATSDDCAPMTLRKYAHRSISRQQTTCASGGGAERVRAVRDHLVRIATLCRRTLRLATALRRASEGFRGDDAQLRDAPSLQETVSEMRLEAVSRLASETMQDDYPALDYTCGALVAPALGLVGEMKRHHVAKRESQLWRVREVAMLSAHRVLDALRGDDYVDGESLVADTRRQVRDALHAAVLRSAALEQMAAPQSDGAIMAMAKELNTYGATVEPPTRGMEVELRARLVEAEAERRTVWVDTQGVVQSEMEQALRRLEALRMEAEREPDVLQKQMKLVQCRELHTGLGRATANVGRIGAALGVVVSFLSSMEAKLDVLGAQLRELQSVVHELGADLRRLVGKPVLEVLEEQLKGRLAAMKQLRAEVYIPVEGLKADENGKFLVSDSNRALDLMQAVKEKFLQSDATSVLLLSGPAGSGAYTLGYLGVSGLWALLAGCNRTPSIHSSASGSTLTPPPPLLDR